MRQPFRLMNYKILLSIQILRHIDCKIVSNNTSARYWTRLATEMSILRLPLMERAF